MQRSKETWVVLRDKKKVTSPLKTTSGTDQIKRNVKGVENGEKTWGQELRLRKGGSEKREKSGQPKRTGKKEKSYNIRGQGASFQKEKGMAVGKSRAGMGVREKFGKKSENGSTKVKKKGVGG